jgi:hypothetical protein
MDLDAPYRLNPLVSFDSLAHGCEHRERCLVGAPDVVRIVRALAMHASARDALDAAELGETTWTRIVTALEHLAATGVIVVDR